MDYVRDPPGLKHPTQRHPSGRSARSSRVVDAAASAGRGGRAKQSPGSPVGGWVAPEQVIAIVSPSGSGRKQYGSGQQWDTPSTEHRQHHHHHQQQQQQEEGGEGRGRRKWLLLLLLMLLVLLIGAVVGVVVAGGRCRIAEAGARMCFTRAFQHTQVYCLAHVSLVISAANPRVSIATAGLR
jgi:hypothetical protein